MLRTDGWTDERTNKQMNEWTDGRTGPTTRPAFAKATQVKMGVYSSCLNCHDGQILSCPDPGFTFPPPKIWQLKDMVLVWSDLTVERISWINDLGLEEFIMSVRVVYKNLS